MKEPRLPVHPDPSGVTFKVYVQPRSSKNMIVGLHGDALKIKIKAPPVEGAANKMCIKYVAECLNLPKSLVEIKSGHNGRMKLLRLRLQNSGNLEKERKKIGISIQALLRQ